MFRISVALPAMLSSPVSPSEFWNDAWIRQTSAHSKTFYPFHPITHELRQSKSVVRHPNTCSIVVVTAGVGAHVNDSYRGIVKLYYWRGRHP